MNPDDAENDLIEAFLEPLPKTGHHAGMVRRMTSHARHRQPQDFAEACTETAAIFRSLPPPSRRGKARLLLAAVIGLVTAAAFIVPPAARHELQLLLVTQANQLPRTGLNYRAREIMSERMLSRVGPQEAKFLFGDLATAKNADRWMGLAEADPSNPGRLADAAFAHMGTDEKQLQSLLAKAETLDPGNGWYAWLEGRALIEPWSSNDSERIDRAMTCFERAIASPCFTDPTTSTWSERLSLLPEEEIWADVVATQRYVANEMPSSSFRFPPFAGLKVIGNATELAVADHPKVKHLARMRLEFIERQLQITRTWHELTKGLDSFASGSSSSRAYSDYLDRADMPDHAKIFTDLSDVFEKPLSATSTAGLPASRLADQYSLGSTTDASLIRPGIAAEWTMHERLLGWLAVFAFGLLLVQHLAVLQSGRGHDLISQRLGQLLTWRDKVIILVISLGFPLFCYGQATRMPGHGLMTDPLSGDHDPRFVLLVILFAGWIVAVPLLALETVRWRLAIRGRAFGLGGSGLHLGMVPLGMVLGSLAGAAVLPAIPGVWSAPRLPLIGLATGIALGALWLLVLTVWHFSASQEAFPERLLRARAAFGPVLAGLLITATGTLALRSHERHLVSINHFEKSPRTHAGNRSSVDQALFEKWQPILLDATRQAKKQLDALD